MRTLYLLRHAKSSWDDPALPDHERPLAPRGIRDAKRIGKHMRKSGIAPELVLCSSARRTRETLDLLGPAIAAAQLEVEDGLYGASAEELLTRLQELPDEVPSALLIGHNPAMQDLTLLLAGGGADLPAVEAKLPTGALATLELEEPWRELGPKAARLAAYVVPRSLA